MRYTEMIDKCYPASKKSIDRNVSLWLGFFIRPISFAVTYVFMLAGISANQATFIGFLVGATSVILAAKGFFFAAALLLNLFLVLDCVDGNPARLSRPNAKGEYYDSIAGDFVNYVFPFVFLYSATSHGLMQLQAILGDDIMELSIVGLSFIQLLTALASQRYKIILPVKSVRNNMEAEERSGVLERLVRNMYGAAFLYPAALLSAFFRQFDLLFIYLMLTGIAFYGFAIIRPIINDLWPRAN